MPDAGVDVIRKINRRGIFWQNNNISPWGESKDLILKKGKTYIGTSAGSIIAGPRLPVYLLDDDKSVKVEGLKGYGFVNFTLLPHWGSEDFKERYLGERLKIVYKDDQVPLLLLTDNQYVHVQNDQIKIVDVKNNR